ncbi:MFS transporter, NNP family, nitrate/nitrite transporter [Sporothrix schenckii 1099-18]|uniref:Nitrate/nitrite transporter n=1 Tax=Sporothrix schenckii 1099-18 TaxID=1397361 RepID=A0A0F2LYE2_SPOSC|nr:MFS transporter, NNP family, nitrate/nitrite transporter [Sporothrix schenckii 1099-18]KJR81879.1 MFS transporter, NNP family, nitrate/nitrite transporter [Sporothrix schenckii 1099-18]
MTPADVANSNMVALLATLIVRMVAGPLCDRFGPRYVYAGILFCGAIPTALAGLVKDSNGLIALRFFIGILGATFVPCQVWCTGFFDRNVVGTANALAGGWGNAGGGVAYFVMPAVFNSLVSSRGLTDHVAWRVAFIVPFILIVAVAVGMLLLCEDTPTGKWSERHLVIEGESGSPPPEPLIIEQVVKALNADGSLQKEEPSLADEKAKEASKLDSPVPEKEPSKLESAVPDPDSEIVTTALGEMVVNPTLREALSVIFSPQSLALAAPYACSFGGELVLDSNIGSYYYKNFPYLGQTGSGNWAAMFGLLNVLFRPAGGLIGDYIYGSTHSVWAKRLWVTFLGVVTGAFELAIGLSDPHSESTMFGLMAGLAFFLEAANGANFSVVPHVHPFANGIVSGLVGASGNFGGIIFAIVFRYHGTAYAKSIWIMGALTMAVNVALGWIKPVPKGQVGGR